MFKGTREDGKNRTSKINKICQPHYNFTDLLVFVFDCWVLLCNIVPACNVLPGDKVTFNCRECNIIINILCTTCHTVGTL